MAQVVFWCAVAGMLIVSIWVAWDAHFQCADQFAEEDARDDRNEVALALARRYHSPYYQHEQLDGTYKWVRTDL